MSSTKHTLKQRSNKFGTEGAGRQTTFAMSAWKAADVKNQYLKLLQDRDIPRTQIQKVKQEDKSYISITQDIGDGNSATTAVRITPYGNDLWIEIRHYETSPKTKANKTGLGIVLTLGGLLFIWTGIGFFVFLGGIAILSSKAQFPDPSPEREASQLLFETVMETLTTALANCDVDAGAQIETDIDF